MLFDINGVGRLTRGPELKWLPSGTAVVKFALAASSKIKDKEKVCFIDAVAFGKTAETINSYFKRGSRIHFYGSLEFEQWTDNGGQNRSKHIINIDKIGFVDSKENQSNNTYNPEHQPESSSSTAESNHNYQSPGAMNQSLPEIDLDEVLFAPIGLQYPYNLHCC